MTAGLDDQDGDTASAEVRSLQLGTRMTRIASATVSHLWTLP
jgi:hypothetical protein